MQHHTRTTQSQRQAIKAEVVLRGRAQIFALIQRGIRSNTKRTGVSKVAYGVRRAILGA